MSHCAGQVSHRLHRVALRRAGESTNSQCRTAQGRWVTGNGVVGRVRAVCSGFVAQCKLRKEGICFFVSGVGGSTSRILRCLKAQHMQSHFFPAVVCSLKRVSTSLSTAYSYSSVDSLAPNATLLSLLSPPLYHPLPLPPLLSPPPLSSPPSPSFLR